MKPSELAIGRTAPWLERRRRREELEFLPAALEIIETPASPAGRAIGGTIIAFFMIALAWATVGHVEIVATAPGEIVPSERTKVIQPLEIGTVRAIRVHDGQSVRSGQVLVELDPTTNAAERNRLASDLTATRLDIARLTAMLSDAAVPLVPPPGATAAQIARARMLVVSKVDEQRAKLAGLDREQQQHDANRAAVAATVDKLMALLPLLRQRVEMRKSLYDREYGSKLNYLSEQQQLVESERELVVQNDRLIEAEAALLAIAERRRQTEAEFRRSLLGDLTLAEEKADSLAQELIKADQRMQLQTLISPIDGVVQQLAIHTLGGVVTPAQTLMVLVPADSRLEIEATVSNQDIGFVHAGQRAAIKVDTFNFTRYGLLHGEVLDISPDAVGAGLPGDEPGTAPRPRSPPRGLAYRARISLDRAAIPVDGKLIVLRPGMAVTVEVNTGSRRVIDYLLSPLRRDAQESLRER